jgi:nitroreductase
MSTTEVGRQDWLAQLQVGCFVTRFKPDPIPPETLQSILEAGSRTTSAWNLQPWQFIVVNSSVGRERLLFECFDPGPVTTAPVLLVGLGDPQAWKQGPSRLSELMRCGGLAPGKQASHLERIQRQWSMGDAARVFAIAQTHAALQQICLAARAFDVCSGWVHEFDALGIARSFQVPENLVVVGVLGLGYCAEKTPLPARSLARTVFAEAYGLPWPPGKESLP